MEALWRRMAAEALQCNACVRQRNTVNTGCMLMPMGHSCLSHKHRNRHLQFVLMQMGLKAISFVTCKL